jgi:para-aminobenzoate synthetase component 1
LSKNSDGLGLGTYPQPRQTPLAAHKTLNYLYYLHAGQWAGKHGYDEALVLNPDGSVSETNTANLLIINGREVIKPISPAVLPGVMVAAVCRELAAMGYTITERVMFPADLSSAEQVLVTNALMGVVPVKAIDHHPISMQHGMWKSINDRLIPRWTDG